MLHPSSLAESLEEEAVGAVLGVMQLFATPEEVEVLDDSDRRWNIKNVTNWRWGREASLLYLLERSQSVPVEEEVVEGVRLPDLHLARCFNMWRKRW